MESDIQMPSLHWFVKENNNVKQMFMSGNTSNKCIIVCICLISCLINLETHLIIIQKLNNIVSAVKI